MSSRRRSTGPPGGWRSGLSSHRFPSRRWRARWPGTARSTPRGRCRRSADCRACMASSRTRSTSPCRWASALATPWCWAPRAWARRGWPSCSSPRTSRRKVRGEHEVVIVFDPKGDADLLKRMYVEAKRAGAKASSTSSIWVGPTSRRATTPWAGSGGYPRWPRASPDSARAKATAPRSANSPWRFVNIIARALVELGQRPDYLLIQRHVINIDALFIEYAQHYFAKNEPKAWEVIVQLEAKLNEKNIPRNMIGREKRVVALEQYLSQVRVYDPVLDGLRSAVRYDRTYFDKIVASLLRCWRSSPPARSRNCSHRTIPTCPTRGRSSTGCRSSQTRGGLRGAGCAVRRRSRGGGGQLDVQRPGLGGGHILQVRRRRRAARRRGERPRFRSNVHADEFNELMGDEFIRWSTRAAVPACR
jgi:hypothetical protein